MAGRNDKYPTVPVLPGEVQTLVGMLEGRYVHVETGVANTPYQAKGGGIIVTVRCSHPKELTRPLVVVTKGQWGGGQYNSLEGAYYAALWAALDESHIATDNEWAEM